MLQVELDGLAGRVEAGAACPGLQPSPASALTMLPPALGTGLEPRAPSCSCSMATGGDIPTGMTGLPGVSAKRGWGLGRALYRPLSQTPGHQASWSGDREGAVAVLMGQPREGCELRWASACRWGQRPGCGAQVGAVFPSGQTMQDTGMAGGAKGAWVPTGALAELELGQVQGTSRQTMASASDDLRVAASAPMLRLCASVSSALKWWSAVFIPEATAASVRERGPSWAPQRKVTVS